MFSTPASPASSWNLPARFRYRFLAEIVGYVKIGPAIAIEVAPGRSKAIVMVVLIETGLGGDVLKVSAGSREMVRKEKFGGSIFRVVIGPRKRYWSSL